MKAAVLTGIRKMEIRDVPDPTIQGKPRRAAARGRGRRVRLGRALLHDRPDRQPGGAVSLPRRARVRRPRSQAVGRGVRRVQARRPRGRGAGHVLRRSATSAAPAGRHTCRKLRFLGCPGQAEGCLCEYIVMPEECCYPVGPRTDAGAGRAGRAALHRRLRRASSPCPCAGARDRHPRLRARSA